jgi:hypothetical protein
MLVPFRAPLAQTLGQQFMETRRLRDLDTIDALIGALEDYKTRLRFKQTSDFEEFKVCEAIIDLFDDGDVTGRREAILDENGWDEFGNPQGDNLLRGEL